MIFVTVGTHPQQFNRLIKAVDDLVKQKKIKERVIIQIGHSNYIPKHCKWFRFTSGKEIEKLYRNASLVITHGGAGSILTALVNSKPIIAVPRLKKFGEHTNDHQVDLVRIMEKEGLLLAVYDISELETIINKVKSFKGKVSKVKELKLLREVESYLNKLSKVFK